MKVWQVGGASAIGMSVAWLLVASVAINNRTICSRALEGLQEKYTHGYSSKNLTVDLDGPVYAAWKWDGRIERTDFESNLDTGTWSVAFKILESKLFVRGNDEVLENTMSNRVFESRYNSMVELLLLAIHMYDIPDMDFIVDFSDGVECGRATFSYFLNTACVNAGFSLPSNAVYMEALGPQQLDGLSKCFQYEYPYHARDPKGLWHLPVGNATDNNENLFDISNMELESVAMRWPTLMAAVPANQVQLEIITAAAGQGLITLPVPIAPHVKQCNEYAVVLSVDGDLTSNGLAQLLSYNTPILKQRSAIQEYYDHMLVPGVHLETFAFNLSDIVPKLAAMIIDYKSWWRRGYLHRMVSNMHAFAKEHTSHLGVVRAAAYGLSVYASKLSWEVVLEEGYQELPKTLCCTLKPENSLPLELVRAVKDPT